MSKAICLGILSALIALRSYGQESVREYQGVSGAQIQDEHGVLKAAEAARTIAMGDRLIVEVTNLDGWLYELISSGRFPQQEWFDPAAVKLIGITSLKSLYERTNASSDDQQKLALERTRDAVEKMLVDVEQRLYLQLGPARLRHLRAEDPLVKQGENGVFRFVFAIHDTPEDRAEWNKLRSTHGELRPISISLAFDVAGLTHTLRTKLGSSLDSVIGGNPQQQFRFQVYSRLHAGIFAFIYIGFIVLFGWFANAPNLLRDPDGPVRNGKHVFSLSRCQLAWWFFIILAAWIFLLVTTASRDTLNQTALIVAGIGSATALSGALAGKVKESVTGASLADRVVDVGQRPGAFQRGPGAWLFDVLSDDMTVGFHRFQLLVWNVILGVVFMFETWSDFTMPEFNTTLLGLLGLSAATFVGMKMTPNQ
jgi:hypothetical protein